MDLTDVTILIPTKDRPAYLRRALTYYQYVKFPGRILIGDGSLDERNHWLNRKAAEETELNIHIERDPIDLSYNDGHSIANLCKQIYTKYAIQAGDDDLILIPTLETAVAVLDEEVGYDICRGERLVFTLDRPEPYGIMQGLTRIGEVPRLTQDNPMERWVTWLQKSMSLQSCLVRSETFKKAYHDAGFISLRYWNNEFLPVSGLVILSKVYYINKPMLMFQKTEGPKLLWDMLSMWDLIRDETWPRMISYVRRRIIDMLKPHEPDSDRLHSFVDQNLWGFLTTHLHAQHFNRYHKRTIFTHNAAGLDEYFTEDVDKDDQLAVREAIAIIEADCEPYEDVIFKCEG